MYAVNQREETHIWWQWALKYLSASWQVRMDLLELIHLQYLSIKRNWWIPMINNKEILHWCMYIPRHYKIYNLNPKYCIGFDGMRFVRRRALRNPWLTYMSIQKMIFEELQYKILTNINLQNLLWTFHVNFLVFKQSSCLVVWVN